MTTFKTAESPFKSDNTASNRCGFTLMNNQVGALIAQVMGTKDNVTVMPLPSMIRVDAVNRMDVVYSEMDDAAGEEEGWFTSAEFEENMSTHYGRMIHEDDRTIMFANPEDAAEFIDFDLKATDVALARALPSDCRPAICGPAVRGPWSDRRRRRGGSPGRAAPHLQRALRA